MSSTIQVGYIGNARKKLYAPFIQTTKDGFKNDLKGVFITHIDDIVVFTKPDAIEKIKLITDSNW